MTQLDQAYFESLFNTAHALKEKLKQHEAVVASKKDDPRYMLLKKIDDFDRYYHYSDDSSVYRNAERRLKELLEEIQTTYPEEAKMMARGLTVSGYEEFLKHYLETGDLSDQYAISSISSEINKDRSLLAFSYGASVQEVKILNMLHCHIKNIDEIPKTHAGVRFAKGRVGLSTSECHRVLKENEISISCIAVNSETEHKIDALVNFYKQHSQTILDGLKYRLQGIYIFPLTSGGKEYQVITTNSYYILVR